MNHFSYDVMSKEKVRNLQNEGVNSQSFHRSGAPKLARLRGVPKLALTILGFLGLISLLVR